MITRIVAFQTYIVRGSSGNMGEGQMKKIHLLFMNVPDSLPINYTTLKVSNLPSSYIRKHRI
jgi:hypothetical protein